MELTVVLDTYRQIVDRQLAAYLDRVEKEFQIEPFLAEQYRVMRDLVLRGGKRLRPISLIAAYQAVGGQREELVYLPAVAMELFHNHTLIHDDIYDEDTYRRGDKTAHTLLAEWYQQRGADQAQATLYQDGVSRFAAVGGFINGKMLYVLATRALWQTEMTATQREAIFPLYFDLSLIDNLGQALDLALEGRAGVSETDYLTAARYKTATLFQTCVEMGAVLGRATPSQRQAMGDYMIATALAFQIFDDLMDLGVGQKGRPVGTDLRKGKRTLPVIIALQRADPAQALFLRKVLGRQDVAQTDIAAAIEIVEKTGALTACQDTMRDLMAQAKAALRQAMPPLVEESRVFFEELADFMAVTRRT